MQLTVFDLLDHDWKHLAVSRTARRSVERWAHDAPWFSAYRDLADVAAANARSSPAGADRILAVLARRAAHDDLAARTLLQLMLPGCKRLAQRLGRRNHDPDEHAAAVVAAAYCRIRTYPAERRPTAIAPNVLWDTAKAVRRQQAGRALEQTSGAELDPDDRVVRNGPSAAEELLEHLLDAVRSGILTPSEMELVASTRLLDRPISELARQRGRHPGTLRRQRAAIEQLLVAVADANFVRPTAGDPGVEPTLNPTARA